MKIIWGLIILAVGLGLGFLAGRSFSRGGQVATTASPSAETKEVRLESGYKFIQPLLRCETVPQDSNAQTKAIHQAVANYLGSNQSVSVYFLDPSDGSWFSVNPNAKYTPSSLLKVAAMMVFYTQARTHPEVLTQKLKFPGPVTGGYNFFPQEQLTPGQEYSVNELIERMLVFSDNDAKDLLLKNVTDAAFNQVFADVQVDLPQMTEPENFMTVKDYDSFFRALYNAAYLGKTYSEQALEIMSRGNFKQGLVAGVPAGTAVSHKFGENANLATGVDQLHDCGIVYHPNGAYHLCVMTRGNNFLALAKIISEISKIVYAGAS